MHQRAARCAPEPRKLLAKRMVFRVCGTQSAIFGHLAPATAERSGRRWRELARKTPECRGRQHGSIFRKFVSVFHG
jgi:hypothetical protein